VAAAIVQTCVIHLLCNSFRLSSRMYHDQIAKNFELVYTASSPDAARARFEAWGSGIR
jgi:putative transposase